MAGLGDNVGILFRIKADSADAIRDLSKVKTEITGVGAAGVTAGGGLASMINPATLVAAGIVAVGAAAVTATVALGRLIVSSAEFGSTLYDASVQTGLSARSISALKLAADSSGSSLEAVSGAVAKFNVLVGRAAVDSTSKAAQTLRDYGITATDTNEAFEQAVKVIGEMTSQTEKAAASQALFKDRQGAMLPVIDQVNGNFKEYIKTAERLGVVLTEEDLRAADEFGDALALLGQQATIAGAKFTSDFMPDLVEAMSNASKFIGKNMETVREWGRAIEDTVNGAITVLNVLGVAIALPFQLLDSILANNAIAWNVWRGAVTVAIRAVLAFATAGISEIIIRLNELGQKLRAAKEGDKVGAFAGGSVGIAVGLRGDDGGGGGGGGRRGGGGGGGSSALKSDLQAQIQLQRELLSDAETEYREQVKRLAAVFKDFGDEAAYSLGVSGATQVFTDTSAEILAKLRELEDRKAALEKESDAQTKLREKNATDRTKKVAKSIFDEQQKVNDQITDAQLKLANERRKIEEQLRNDIAKMSQDTSDAIHNQLIQNANDEIEEAKRVYENQVKYGNLTKKQRQKAFDELIAILSRNAAALIIEEKAIFENKVIALDEWKRKTEEEIADNVKDEDERKAMLEQVNQEYERRLNLLKAIHAEEQTKIDTATTPSATVPSPYDFGLAGSWEDFKNSVLQDGPTIAETLSQIGSIGVQAFAQLAQGIGSMVQAWVLYGTVGPNAMKKMVATVLAGVAAQAAVLAIFELGKGFAALFWNPAEAAAHFKAAALFGSIAVASALGGRAVAGDSFNQSTAGGGAGGAGQGDQQQQRNNYTTPFRGFDETIRRQTVVLGQLEETVHQFNKKTAAFSPGEIVGIGAVEASGEIRKAYESELGNDVGTTENFFRRTGQAG